MSIDPDHQRVKAFDLTRKVKEVLDEVEHQNKIVIITRYNKPAAAVISIRHLEELQER